MQTFIFNCKKVNNSLRAGMLCLMLLISIQDSMSQDLIVDQTDLRSSLSLVIQNFAPTTSNCLIEERCISSTGDRKLLKFNTTIANIGTKDFVIGIPSNNDPRWNLNNCHETTNDPNVRHPHYHYEGYAHYRLFDSEGKEQAIGFKSGFYVMDSKCSGTAIKKYGIPGSDGTQGISAGCADVYGSSLLCQWLDITGIRNGIYTLTITTNPNTTTTDPAAKLYETNYSNNTACATISIEGTSMRQIVDNDITDNKILPITTVTNGQQIVKKAFTKLSNSASYIIQNGSNVIFQSGKEIQLLPGFEAQVGSTFFGFAKFINICSPTSGSRIAASVDQEETQTIKKLYVHPNPSNDFFDVSVNEISTSGETGHIEEVANRSSGNTREYILFNSFGQKIYSIKSNAATVRIQTILFNEGFYILYVKEDDKFLATKVIIEK